MKWPQRGEPLSLIGGCGRGGVGDWGKDWQASPSAVLFQSLLKYLKQRCELLIQPVKSLFFPPKVTAKMLTIFGGSRSGWDVKPFESTLPTKGNEEGLYLFSWDWPNSKHQSHWIKAHTPLTGTAINPVFSPPTESPPDNAIPTKAFPATAERELDYTAVTKWLETPQHSTLLATKQEDYPI